MKRRTTATPPAGVATIRAAEWLRKVAVKERVEIAAIVSQRNGAVAVVFPPGATHQQVAKLFRHIANELVRCPGAHREA